MPPKRLLFPPIMGGPSPTMNPLVYFFLRVYFSSGFPFFVLLFREVPRTYNVFSPFSDFVHTRSRRLGPFPTRDCSLAPQGCHQFNTKCPPFFASHQYRFLPYPFRPPLRSNVLECISNFSKLTGTHLQLALDYLYFLSTLFFCFFFSSILRRPTHLPCPSGTIPYSRPLPFFPYQMLQCPSRPILFQFVFLRTSMLFCIESLFFMDSSYSVPYCSALSRSRYIPGSLSL